MGPRARDLTPLFVDAGGLVADMTSVDALARLVLVARRHGCEPRICGLSAELERLIELAGLAGVLTPRPPIRDSSAPMC
jgi:anti-anti-sigma regulatory factor